MARLSVTNADDRMKGALSTIRNVADSVGESTPLVATGYLAATAAMLFFRSLENFLEDMINDPAWVDQMCRVAADWTLDWIRCQYDAGANSVTFVADSLGTHLISPSMGERYNLPYLCDLVQTIKKEFNQGVWLHIHGNMNTPLGFAYLEKIINEAGVEGLHLDDCHTPDWIKEKVVNKFNVPACIASNCHKIAQGPVERIQTEVKTALAKVNDGLGLMMAPCCQVLPHTPNAHFKAWVDATHEYGKFPLTG
jgi:uroporphyrinogen-III decarboxylase